MTVSVITTGASSHYEAAWHAIDWQACHIVVKRLQARIVKAVQSHRWNKVKALQRLLTSSFSGKALAVKRVTENKGKRTSGVDKEIWSTPASKYDAIGHMEKRGYRPQPLRRIYIPKAKGGQRPLSIPCMIDRAQQSLHLLALDPILETQADNNSYGFRQGRSCADAIEQCFNTLAKKASAPWILEGDIKNCFGEISSDYLLKHIPMDREILRKWLKVGYIEKGQWHATENGAPAGGAISPALMNRTLDGLESLLQQKFKTKKGQSSYLVNYVRYADDFIITGRTQELLENEVKPLVEAFLAERGLRLSDTKTRSTPIQEGFDFLGVNIRKYNGKLLIKPSKDSGKRIAQKIGQEVKRHYGSTQAELIQKLNPIIRGWTNYHRHNVAKETFQKLGYQIWQRLWHWSKRRHPKKGKRWVIPQYFHTLGGNKWTFACKVQNKQHQTIWLKLFNPATVAIKRHIKVKGKANPYDPARHPYFETRQQRRMTQDIWQGRWIHRTLYRQQKGLCPLCQQSITEETGWHIHHRVPKAEGGSDEINNLILLHPNCHRQHHVRRSQQQKKSVARPALEKGLTEA